MYDWLAELEPERRVLDLASGGGSYEYGRFPFSTVGLDEDPDAFRNAALKPSGSSHRVVGRSDRLPFRDGAFDLVVCHHALEHVVELEPTLDEIRRVLRPEGRVYLSVPDGHSLCDAVYRYVYEGGGHVQRYRLPALRALVEQRVGVRLLKWQTLYSSFSYLRWLANRAGSAAPGGLGPKTSRILRLPAGAILAVQFLLHSGTRVFDRLLRTNLAIYGWAFYFSPHAVEAEELPGYANVCLHCGTGHPASEIDRLRRVCYRCPACNHLNPFFPPFGNRV